MENGKYYVITRKGTSESWLMLKRPDCYSNFMTRGRSDSTFTQFNTNGLFTSMIADANTYERREATREESQWLDFCTKEGKFRTKPVVSEFSLF